MSTNINYAESVTQIITPSLPSVLTLNQQGPPGPQGAKGDTGDTGPAGADGQDGTGDKTFRVSFTNAISQVVAHNLDKYPSVVFRDSAGTQYEVSVQHDTLNQCTVTWNQTTTGSITCN